MKAVNSSMGLLEWLLIVALSVLWGGSFFFVEVAVGALAPFTIVALRVGLAALALNIIVLAMGLRMPRNRQLWSAFLGMGFLNNMVPFSLIVWGQAHISSGLASILNASTPFFTVVAAHYLTSDEKMTGRRLAGVVLGVAGVVFMIGLEALEGLVINTLAQLAVIGAAISYALAGIYGRRFRNLDCSPLITATGQVTTSAIVLVPLALMIEQPWIQPLPAMEVWWAVLGLALLSTALAYIVYFRILATAGATNLLLVTFLIPISAMLLGTAILGEQLEPKHFGGIGLIGLGLAAIDGRLFGILRRSLFPNRRKASPTLKEPPERVD
ncbi:DMT family transporter [Marinobacter sp. 71-i]|uniref:DMT family transporter n=1 Tax=Marinobacter iranensis TaxID=2962607 RepID=A0ABT5YB77_9GAMM|nr:DMT family transporter [Marinobacter iranensis]MDF0750944.1 DMT family transporter [Marinobacter iranensis]